MTPSAARLAAARRRFAAAAVELADASDAYDGGEVAGRVVYAGVDAHECAQVAVVLSLGDIDGIALAVRALDGHVPDNDFDEMSLAFARELADELGRLRPRLIAGGPAD